MPAVPVLMLPGIGNSGPEHWQTRWQAAHPSYDRVMQRDWDHPVRSNWVAVLDRTVAESGSDTVLVAHSLACLTVAHWALLHSGRIGGAFLVAPPEPEGPSFPKEAVGFSPLPMEVLPFPSILVASTDDPYGPVDFARRCASAWNSRFVTVGAAGHINAASSLGDWPEGEALFMELIASTRKVG